MRELLERIGRGVPRRRHAGVGRARMVEVERKIAGHDALAVDVVEQPPIARAEQDIVMRDVGIGALHPEMDHEQRGRSEEHTSELQSLMRISYAVFCLKKKKQQQDMSRL